MASKGQKFNKYTPEFRNEIVSQFLYGHKSYGYLAKIYGISKKLPPLNFVSKPSDSETSHPAEKTFHYPQTHLSFMSLPMREAMTPLDEDKTIADLALPITLKKLFQGRCLWRNKGKSSLRLSSCCSPGRFRQINLPRSFSGYGAGGRACGARFRKSTPNFRRGLIK